MIPQSGSGFSAKDRAPALCRRGACLHVMARRLLPSLRGGGATEAIQAGRPSNHGGGRTVLYRPILDCFALASLALAMTGRRPRRESCAGGGGAAMSTVIAR